ncbi:hypothetical protein [Providencia rettgeri]|nr:hypothetical protein [Providencia rettgeri]
MNNNEPRNSGAFLWRNTMAAQGFDKPEQFREELDKSIPKE